MTRAEEELGFRNGAEGDWMPLENLKLFLCEINGPFVVGV